MAEAYKPACRECHVYFSKQREKGNLNIKNIQEKENKENLTPLKDKELKDFGSSSTLSSNSPMEDDLNEIVN